MINEKKIELYKHIDLVFLQGMQECPDPNQLLELCRFYGQFHSLNLTDRWSNIPVENHVYKVMAPHLADLQTEGTPTRTTHVISEGYDCGGHTPICVNLLKTQKNRGDDVQLFVTRAITKNNFNELTAADIPLLRSPSQGVALLRSVTHTLLNSKAVILHIHPEDIISCIAAMHAERAGIPCYFINHANIRFSYGPAHCTALMEIMGSSWLASEKYRHPRALSFFGVPASPLPIPPKDLEKPQDREDGYFISVGTENKFQFDKSDLFLNFIEFLCGELNQKLVLVGPKEHPKFAKLSDQARSNLSTLGMCTPNETLEHVAGSIAYIDSFPECGGTSVVNAMKIGLPLFGFRQHEGMYGEDFLSDSFDGLCNDIRDFLKNGYDSDRIKERRDFMNNEMSIEACLARLDKTMAGEMCPIPYDFDARKIDLNYHHKIWNETDDLFVPSVIKLNKNIAS
jgi:hypothetical protein